MIGVLVDLKLSVEKIDDKRHLIITEDGLLFRLNQTHSSISDERLSIDDQGYNFQSSNVK